LKWARYVAEYTFYGYLHGVWYNGENYWETETYREATLSQRWEYWVGYTIGRGKRERLIELGYGRHDVG